MKASAGADLLVVGSRGLGKSGSALLGPVSQHCADYAACPIIIVPSSHRDEPWTRQRTPCQQALSAEPGPAAGTMRPLSPADLARIAAIAGRGSSLHNSQPWRFRAGRFSVDVLADRTRQLRRADGTGRELLISCGAALFGVRLGMRALGHLPAAKLFPDPDRPDILARVRLAGRAAITAHEAELLAAVPHRHTHRGGFAPGDISPRLIAGMRIDAAAEQAGLLVLADPDQVALMAGLVLRAAREQAASPELVGETASWVRSAAEPARDGSRPSRWHRNTTARQQIPGGCRSVTSASVAPRPEASRPR